MFPNRLSRSRTWLAVLALLASIAGCAPVSPAGPAAGTPVAPGDAPTATPLPGGADAAAAVNMRRLLAQQLGAPIDTVKIVKVEPTEWPDSCLGAATPGEVCSPVVTPGYRLTYEVSGQSYELHTDPQGYQWRVAASPAPIIGPAVLQWTGTGEDGSCREAILGADAIAFGRCGGRLLGAAYVAPGRATELQEFAARYAPFDAQTPAGAVKFSGTGAQQAGAAEQRMLGEWAWLAQTEAQTGQAGVSWGLALSWHREGGLAGFCDDLTIDTSGEVFASGCKGGSVQPVGGMRLDAEQLGKLYGWMDRLTPFEHSVKDPATADAIAVRLLFAGRGTDEPTPAERDEVALFAQDLYRRLAGASDGSAAPGATALCPQPTAELQTLINPAHGYCLSYPRLYKVEKPNPDETLLVIGGLLNASDARSHIAVTDAGDKSTSDVAAAFEAEFKDMGLRRSETTVAGATAVVMDNVPGQEINRRVFFVRDGRLYSLMFAPAGENAGEASSAMEALYDQVVRSFTFIPATTQATNDCLSPGPNEELFLSGSHGFCLLHPAAFSADESLTDQVTLSVGSVQNAEEPRLFVNVEAAEGRTAEDAAEAVAAEAQQVLSGLKLDRSFGWTIGYEPAAFLDGVPGQDLSRQVLVVHGDRLYRLTFVPSDPAAQPDVTGEMDELFELVLRSWRFLD